MEGQHRSIMMWFGVVGIVCFALVPIRVYVLNANDWLTYLLPALGIAFLGGFFVLRYYWNRDGKTVKSSASS